MILIIGYTVILIEKHWCTISFDGQESIIHLQPRDIHGMFNSVIML